MTKKQLHGLIDCLANVCTFNTSEDYSLSLQEFEWDDYYHATLLVFTMDTKGVFSSSDIEQLLSLANVWKVQLYFETVNGVTVAKFI